MMAIPLPPAAALGLVALALAALIGWVRRHPAPFPAWLVPMLESRLRRRFMRYDQLVASLALRPGMHVLEIGPGGGGLTAQIARDPCGVSVTCLDVQPAMLARTRGAVPPAVAMVCGDAARLPFADGTVDRVVMVTVLGEVPDRAAALRECARVLGDGGWLVVVEAMPDPDYLPAPQVRAEAAAAGLVQTGHEGPWYRYTLRLARDGGATAAPPTLPASEAPCDT